MSDEYNPVKYFIFSVILATFTSTVVLQFGVLPVDFYDTLNSAHVLEFIGIAAYLVSLFCFLWALGCIAHIFVYLVYRVSLRYIYRKPCRVYPAEKEKLFSLR